MDALSSNAASTAATAARVESAVGEARETALSDFNDFLTLLTAQLKNQDPLAPLDSTQFVEQLASFSAVEQQVGSNEKLSRLIEQGVSDEMSKLSGWIGRTVEAESALFELGADGIDLPLSADQTAVSAEARIVDDAGEEVARIDLHPKSDSFEWSGELTNGGQAPDGHYGVSFVYSYKDETTRIVDSGASGAVIEARVDDDGPMLFLQSGALVRPSDVNALRVATVPEEA